MEMEHGSDRIIQSYSEQSVQQYSNSSSFDFENSTSRIERAIPRIILDSTTILSTLYSKFLNKILGIEVFASSSVYSAMYLLMQIYNTIAS